jgi:C4-dicarboxylate transporter, DctM subunit
MSAASIGGLGILFLFVLCFLQVPVGLAMIAVGVGSFAMQAGWAPALTFLASEPANQLGSVDIAIVPLFLLMGSFASIAGFSEDIYAAAAAFLGHRRGGLAYATIVGSALFGAICGSTLATAATFSKVALPEMRRRGYSPSFAAGSIGAGGALKSLIPPSLVMILYCIVTKTFIFDLFLAAVVPALLTVALNLAAILITTRVSPAVAPVSPRIPWRERGLIMWRAWPALLLMATIFGGLYSGMFTVNEAASVAAVLSLVFALLRRRLTWGSFVDALLQAARTTCMIYIIIIGASVFTYSITLARLPETLVAWVEALNLAPLAVIVVLLLGYIVLGTIFDEISAILITLPFVVPVVVAHGYDPVWWGVMNVIQIELAMIHPPLGIVVFLLHGVAPDIPMRKIYLGVLPFLIADFFVLVVLTLFPELTLWLPRLMGP